MNDSEIHLLIAERRAALSKPKRRCPRLSLFLTGAAATLAVIGGVAVLAVLKWR